MNNTPQQRTLNTIDQAIHTQMMLIEHHLTDMLENIHEALDELQHSKRNRAIGTLTFCDVIYQQVTALYHAILIMHRNSHVIERPDD